MADRTNGPTAEEIEAKKRAHAWERAIRQRQRRGASSPEIAATASASVKVIAMDLADRARLIDGALAKRWHLPAECIGQVGVWAKLETIGSAVGQHRSEVSKYLTRLEAAGDLVKHDRRHRRLQSVYVLVSDGVALRGELGDLPTRTGARSGISQLETDERVGKSRPSELGDSVERVGKSPNANPSSNPISKPVRRGRARARTGEAAESPFAAQPARLPPGEKIEAAIRLLAAGYASRFEAALGDPWMSAGANHDHIGTVAAYVVKTAADDLEGRVERVLDGYFRSRPDLRERRWPWRYLAEDPGRYADRKSVARAETASAVSALRAELDRLKRAKDENVDPERSSVLDAELEEVKRRIRAARQRGAA